MGIEPIEINDIQDLDGLIVNVEIVDFPSTGRESNRPCDRGVGRPDDFGIDVEIIIRKSIFRIISGRRHCPGEELWNRSVRR